MEKMGELEQFSTLIGDIYDAALDPALWGNVLEQTCQFVNGYNAGLPLDSVIITCDKNAKEFLQKDVKACLNLAITAPPNALVICRRAAASATAPSNSRSVIVQSSYIRCAFTS
jgi:hypothetical protein